MNMYTESYLKTEIHFVNEWNSYYYSGRYRNIIESSIDYSPNENYGLKLNTNSIKFSFMYNGNKLRMQGLKWSRY